MGDFYQKVQPGQQMRGMPAAVYNTLIDLLNKEKRSQHSGSGNLIPHLRCATLVHIANDSQTDVSVGEALGISTPVCAPTYPDIQNTSLDEFRFRFTLIGVVPTFLAHRSKFAILTEPLPYATDGKGYNLGLGVIDGVCAGLVSFADQKCFDLDDSADIGRSGGKILESTTGGSAQILWRDPLTYGKLDVNGDADQSGTKWCVLRLGPPPTAIQWGKAQEDWEEDISPYPWNIDKTYDYRVKVKRCDPDGTNERGEEFYVALMSNCSQWPTVFKEEVVTVRTGVEIEYPANVIGYTYDQYATPVCCTTYMDGSREFDVRMFAGDEGDIPHGWRRCVAGAHYDMTPLEIEGNKLYPSFPVEVGLPDDQVGNPHDVCEKRYLSYVDYLNGGGDDIGWNDFICGVDLNVAPPEAHTHKLHVDRGEGTEVLLYFLERYK